MSTQQVMTGHCLLFQYKPFPTLLSSSQNTLRQALLKVPKDVSRCQEAQGGAYRKSHPMDLLFTPSPQRCSAWVLTLLFL